MKTAILVSLGLLIAMSTPPALAQGTTPAPVPSAPTNGAAIASDYRLVVGDKLRIEVYREPQLSQSLQIRPDGKITLPLADDIVAAGHTPTALRDSIVAALKEYITNPVVTVIVVETEPQTVSVMGEVNNPGPQPVKGPLTVLEALAMAGGFKDFANTRNILIRRPTPTGVQTIRVNYRDAIRSDSKAVYLQPGDIVIVP